MCVYVCVCVATYLTSLLYVCVCACVRVCVSQHGPRRRWQLPVCCYTWCHDASADIPLTTADRIPIFRCVCLCACVCVCVCVCVTVHVFVTLVSWCSCTAASVHLNAHFFSGTKQTEVVSQCFHWQSICGGLVSVVTRVKRISGNKNKTSGQRFHSKNSTK